MVRPASRQRFYLTAASRLVVLMGNFSAKVATGEKARNEPGLRQGRSYFPEWRPAFTLAIRCRLLTCGCRSITLRLAPKGMARTWGTHDIAPLQDQPRNLNAGFDSIVSSVSKAEHRTASSAKPSIHAFFRVRRFLLGAAIFPGLPAHFEDKTRGVWLEAASYRGVVSGIQR